MAGTSNDGNTDVFDVAYWIDRANGRSAATALARSAPIPPYEPRHRADVPVDSVA